MRRILEVFVGCLQKAEVEAIHFDLWQKVGAEKDAVGVFEEECTRAVGLTSQLGCAGADVDLQVGECIELLGEVCKVFGALCTVSADEGCAGMTGDDAIPLLKQSAFADGRVMKSPVGMCRQFFVALIVRVDGLKECAGIGGMEHDWEAQLAAFLEEGSEPLVVDAKQRATGVAQGKAEVFPEFDPAGTVFDHPVEAIEGKLHKVWPFHAAPVHPPDRGESVGRCLMESVHNIE